MGIESLVANWVLEEIEETGVLGWAWRANAVTYGAIALFLVGDIVLHLSG